MNIYHSSGLRKYSPGQYNRSTILGICLSICMVLSSCLGLGEDANSGRHASVQLVPIVSSTAKKVLAKNIVGVAGENLESFQVAIKSIYLAKDVDLSSNTPSGLIPFFTEPGLEGANHTEIVNFQNAADPVNDKFYVDLMTVAGRSRISEGAMFDENHLGEYNYVVINWAPAFKLQATVPMGNGGVVYTKPGLFDASKGNFQVEKNMLTGPSEIAVVGKNNGGTFFHFLQPLVLTTTDLTSSKLVHDTSMIDGKGHVLDTLVPAGELRVLLVFNPDNFLTAWDSTYPGTPMQPELTATNGLGHIQVPFLDATVVPYRQGEEVWRETYIFEAENNLMPGQFFRVRLELYTVGENLVAASSRALVGPNGEFPIYAPIIFFAEKSGSGTLSLQDNKHVPMVRDFLRLPSVGSTGKVDLTISMIHVAMVPYTLTEKKKMN